MKKASTAILLATTLLALVSCGEDSNDYNYKKDKDNASDIVTDPRQKVGPIEAQTNLEFPALKQSGCVVIVHKAILNDQTKEQGINYAVEWDTSKRTQRWTCYKAYSNVIRSDIGSKNVSRYYTNNGETLTPTSQYPNDPDLPAEYRFTADPYKGSGYDHGHICPSADRLRATEANYQTFFLSNMQPQTRALNGSVDYNADYSPWYRIESRVRTWAMQSDTLYVCKGGYIGSSTTTIGSGANKIPVPSYFFVALLSKRGATYKAVGFWMKHESNYTKQAPLSSYTMNIRELESKTGMDFFCNLKDETERDIENADMSDILNDWTIQ